MPIQVILIQETIIILALRNYKRGIINIVHIVSHDTTSIYASRYMNSHLITNPKIRGLLLLLWIPILKMTLILANFEVLANRSSITHTISVSNCTR